MSDDDFEIRDFLPYLLAQAAERCSLGFQARYKAKYGLLRTEWRVLFHLGRYGRLTATDIGRRANIHKTKISRAVARLEDRRFLTRKGDSSDRRVEWLDLTGAGQAAYRDLSRMAETYQAEVVADLGPEGAAALQTALRHLAGLPDAAAHR